MANLGMYHPTYNPTGARRASDNLPWYSTTVNFNSTADCFNTAKLDLTSGVIGGSTGTSNQYSFADAIYAGQVEDLRLNANKLDVNQLREESMRKAVAGEMRGKGKVPFTQVSNTLLDLRSGGNNIEWYASNDPFLGGSSGFNRVFCSNLTDVIDPLLFSKISANRYLVNAGIGVRGDDGTWYPVYGIEAFSDSYILYMSSGTNVTSNFTNLGAVKVITCFTEFNSEFDSLPWVDIIGDPERIAATFPDGVVGQWIPQIPDGSSKEFQLNTKLNGSGFDFVVRSLDNGSSWTGVTTQFNGFLNTTRNSLTNALAASYVALLTYESHSNFTEPSNNSVVIGSVGDVFTTVSESINQGNRLHPSLVEEIGKSAVSDPTFKTLSVISKQLFDGKFIYESKHEEVDLANAINDSTAVKALSTITNKNGLLYLQLHGSELVYNDSSATKWGDDQLIPILDGEGTKTDLNGTTVKTFCHHTQIPLGITNYNKTTT